MTGPGPGLLLVPTERHLEAELPLRGPAARGRIFRELVEHAAAALAPEQRLAPAHTTPLLTHAALARLPDARLRFPEEPAARVALAHAVDRAVGRLRRAGTTRDHLFATGTKPAIVLAEVVADVDDRLAASGLCDPRGAAGLVAAGLAGRGAPDALGEEVDAITVAGMLAWEPDDRALLEALHGALRAAGGAGVTVELPRLAGPVADAFGDAIAPVADELERRWASLTDAPEIAWKPSRSGSPSLVIAARDADGEARAVVARVLDALGDGTPAERIGIVVPDLDEARLGPLRAALVDARVPFAEPRGRPVASCPEARVALGLLAMAAGPVTRDQAIELLRAPGVHPGAWMDRAGSGEAVRRAVTLAHRLREVPVEVDRTGRLFVDALTDVTRERPDEAWMPRALERMLKETRWVGASNDALAERTPRREVARRLLAVVDRIGLGRPTLRELGAALGREGKSPELATATLALRALGDSAAAVRGLREAVRALLDGAAAAGLADEPVSATELGAELSVAVRDLGLGLGTSGPSAVRVARPADLAGLTGDLVIVTGLAERAYSGAEGDTALLDEGTRRLLPPGCRPPSSRERAAWRRAELAWTMAGSDRVILSHPAGGAGDEGAAHDLVRWARVHGAATHEEPASRVARHASRTDARSAELGALASGAPARGEIGERAAVERARTAFFLDPRTIAAESTGRVALGDEVSRKRWVAAVGGDTPERPVAVTAIERAAGCAFAGFARRVLRVRRAEDLGESADGRERGTLVHRALHAAFEASRGAVSRSEAVSRARDAAERALGLGSSMAPLRREAVAAAVAEALDVVERAFEPGQTLRPFANEQRFGPAFDVAARASRRRVGSRVSSTSFLAQDEREPDADGSRGAHGRWAALSIDGAGDGGPVLYVDGQIDRVDLTPDGRRARVVDYKTGRLPAADEHGKRSFQLPLYAAVVARTLGCEDVEAVYVALKPRGVIEEWPRADEDRRLLGARRDEIARAARRVILRLWEGDAAPRPAKATICTRCEARDVCRRPAVAPLEEAEER